MFRSAQLISGAACRAVGNGDLQSPASQLQTAIAAREEKNWRSGRLSARADLAFLCLQLGLPDTALNAAQTLLEVRLQPLSQTVLSVFALPVIVRAADECLR